MIKTIETRLNSIITGRLAQIEIDLSKKPVQSEMQINFLEKVATLVAQHKSISKGILTNMKLETLMLAKYDACQQKNVATN